MKNEVFVGIILLAAIIIGTIYLALEKSSISPEVPNSTATEHISNQSVTESSDIAGRLSHNLVLETFTKADRNSILVYRTLPPVVTDEKTLEYAKKFNVTGALRESAVVQSKDLRYGIEISKKSGSIRYMDQDRPNVKMDSPDKLPSDDEAIQIATKFLKDRDLYPVGATVTPPRREYTFSSKNTITYGRVCVWFNRTLNDLKVEGTQLVVYIGGKGDVIGYYANWRNYEPYKEYPVISPDDAFNQLKTEGVGVGMNEKDSLVSINDAYLAYQTTPGAYSEEYLRPVWVFKGNVTVDGKSVMPVEKYIPALTDDAVKSLSSS